LVFCGKKQPDNCSFIPKAVIRQADFGIFPFIDAKISCDAGVSEQKISLWMQKSPVMPECRIGRGKRSAQCGNFTRNTGLLS
jgi:hypothetical protein